MPETKLVLAEPLASLEVLRSWIEPTTPATPRVTVYLPLQRTVPEVRQNALLLERAAREAEQLLCKVGTPADRAATLARSLRRADLDLARLLAGTAALALLVDAKGLRCVALHATTSYQVTAGHSFALRPLLSAWHTQVRYRVLCVSINRVACFEGGRAGLSPRDLPGVPASLPDALGDELTEKQVRMRGTTRGGNSPAYYSHGSARDERKLDLARFHEVLARCLPSSLADPALPIVLAATDEHQGGLRNDGRLPGLVDEPLMGNFDHAGPAELAERAWAILERWLVRRREDALSGWERARNRGKTVDLLDDVAAAALAGRIQRLWVDATRSLPGSLDPATGRVQTDGSDDLLDVLTEVVLRHGGDVQPIEAERLPSPTGVAAELR